MTQVNLGNVRGATGATGAIGATGATGATGENGQVYVPEYNESTGFITWVLEENPSEIISPMYVKGEKGEKGD